VATNIGVRCTFNNLKKDKREIINEIYNMEIDP
jgi:hypothetical protein